MSQTDISQHHRELVIAAEAIIERAFSRNNAKLPAKTQFSRLVNVCGEASCAEEIANYLRYQAGRDAKVWSVAFVKAVIAGVEPVLKMLETEGEQLMAWRRYATYLTRAFTYHDAVKRTRGAQ